MIHRGEVPRVDYRLPKEMPDDVFAQWIDPHNLEVLGSELHRTVVMLLAYTGTDEAGPALERCGTRLHQALPGALQAGLGPVGRSCGSQARGQARSTASSFLA